MHRQQQNVNQDQGSQGSQQQQQQLHRGSDDRSGNNDAEWTQRQQESQQPQQPRQQQRSGHSSVTYSGSYAETLSGGHRTSSRSELLMDSNGTFKFSEHAEDSSKQDQPVRDRRLEGRWRTENGEATFDVEKAEGDDTGDRHFSLPLRQLQSTEPFPFRHTRMPLMSSHIPDFLRLL
jgi:hypothetical protein